MEQNIPHSFGHLLNTRAMYLNALEDAKEYAGPHWHTLTEEEKGAIIEQMRRDNIRSKMCCHD